MNLDASTLWWLMAGVAVAIELLTGTFYLLMLAIGSAAGAVVAHTGLGLTAIVKYRGASWTAIHRPGITPATGPHRVAELVGNRLLVDPL